MRQRRHLPPRYLALLKITFELVSNINQKDRLLQSMCFELRTAWILDTFISLPRLNTVIYSIIKFITQHNATSEVQFMNN